MNHTTTIRAGDILTRPKVLGLITHIGVAVDSNRVLQNTPEKGEHLATVQEFSAGKPVKVHRTGVNPSIAVSRAQTVLSSPQKYDVFQNNCEHTATKIVHGIARSPQLATFGVMALVGVLAIALSRR